MIIVIDYGIGNVGSVHNMLRKCGAKSKISNLKNDIIDAEKLILPGVGHFAEGMNKLNKSGLLSTLEEQVLKERKPILGICLGMQMLAKSSEEGNAKGLGWIDAKVKRLPSIGNLVVPHMGWNGVRPSQDARLFDKEASDVERFYFVHSYYMETDHPELVAATCEYGIEFTASVQADNIYGVQFHPEKSHMYGLALLKRFANL